MPLSTLSKYEHQFELELVNEAVEHETVELRKLKKLHRKAWGVPTLKPTKESTGRTTKRIKTAEDMFRSAAGKGTPRVKEANQMEATGMGKVWMTRRRVDGRLFLAQEIRDDDGVLESASESLLRLLNHNNLVSLVDVVGSEGDEPVFMVWEYCQSGTLSRVLRICSDKRLKMPESFCWHVLHSLTQSLLWLHKGVKIDPITSSAVCHDDDWHTVLVGGLQPTNIFFAAPDGTSPFGPAKLGCFSSATVCIDSKTIEHNDGPSELTSFQPPEIVEKFGSWTTAAEIWSLGAIIYHMMAGHPPDLSLSGVSNEDLEQAWASEIPSNFSDTLCQTVMWILIPEPAGRPSILRFWSVMNHNFMTWQQTTREGRRYGAACKGKSC
ncbi:hypothetical protein FQN54_001633 [Arachnomyces sp. PD_36]|nr:hypothetical protein FQN54_001633 [Arachnomyces sp. PD_36]